MEKRKSRRWVSIGVFAFRLTGRPVATKRHMTFL